MGRRGGPTPGAKSSARPKSKPDHSDVSEGSSEDDDCILRDDPEPERKKQKKEKDPESDDNDEDSNDDSNQKENTEPEDNDSGSEEEEAPAAKPVIEKPKTVMYDCSMCFFSTENDDGFLKHLDELHRRDMGYWCKACGKAYETAAQLLEHIREFCDKVKHFQHACGFPDCGFKTSDPANLIFHFRNEHKGKYLFPCGQCEQQFTILTSLVLHQQDKCSNKDQCALPGPGTAARPKETKEAKKKNNNNGTSSEKRFRCSLCTFETPQQNMFVEHHTDLHMRDLCCCKRCGKVQKNAETLVEHIAKLECTPNKYDHPCGTDGCDFHTYDPLAFRNHIRNGHPRTSLQKCQGCKKQFTIIPLLIMHIQEECSELNTEGREIPDASSNGNSEDTIESVKINQPSAASSPATSRRGRGRGSSKGTPRGRGRQTATRGVKRGRVARDKTPGSSDESEIDDPKPVAPSRSSGRVSKKVSYAHNSDYSEDDF